MENTLAFARQADQNDPLRSFRDRFHLPLSPNGSGQQALYFCGNSLGCQPKAVRAYLEEELFAWEQLAVEGHFHAPHPWKPYHEFLAPALAQIVGAKETEVVAVGSLTTNLHLLMVSFYRPTAERFKILIEDDAFPSDSYAVASQAEFHGFKPAEAIIRMKPRHGEFALRTEDIVERIRYEGCEIAMVLLGGVNYYTGQAFDMQVITREAHAQGCAVGFDLAHAAGNLHLHLHDWNVDFAAWCSYKYLNGGPGAVAGLFVHERHHAANLPRFAGWWGHNKDTRFKMPPGYEPIPTAEAWQHSNAPILSMAALRASLDLFLEAGMEQIRAKGLELSAFARLCISEAIAGAGLDMRIITPEGEAERGCQLSLQTGPDGKAHFERLTAAGIIADWREPDVIRIAPVALYNSFEDVWRFGQVLQAGND